MGPSAPKHVVLVLHQFINSLHEGTELAIVSFSSGVREYLPPTQVEGAGNRERLQCRIPRLLQPGTDTQHRGSGEDIMSPLFY